MISKVCLSSALSLSLVPMGPVALAAAPSPEARVVLDGVLPSTLAEARVLGPMAPGMPLERMVMVLNTEPEAQERLARFLEDVQDPASAAYHRWVSPAQFGERFGPSRAAVDQVAGWLREQGFTLDEVSPGRMSIVFSGDVAKAQAAFATSFSRFEVEGRERHGVTVVPSVPRALAERVEGVLSLHDLPRRAQHTGVRRLPQGEGLTALLWHFIAPGDFAAIYNTAPLYAQGIDGTGVTVAVLGRTNVPVKDMATFRWLYGLAPNPPQVVVNGPDPGDQGSDEDTEADLDVEWSGAVAPKATIKLVVSKSTATTDGVDLSARYAVDHDLAPVVSVSFGECEKDLGKAGVAFYRNLWAQAAAQGISVVVASGDSGPAGCDGGSASAGTGAAVSGLASTPSNLAVGGTQFADGTGGDWGDANGKGWASAKGYIPEVAWNESGNWLTGGIWATSGGPSSSHAKPAWQKAPGVPADGWRDLPDVSLAAAQANGYLLQTGGWPSMVGGTSCGAPAFAGILALVAQHAGGRLGNPCPALYRLGAAQYAASGPRPFHDILTGTSTVPGTTGYACTPGYDLATGLGTVDAKALVEAWPVKGK